MKSWLLHAVRMRILIAIVTAFGILPPCYLTAITPSAAEIKVARRWAAARLEAGPKKGEPFFSFTYGGRPSKELLRTWKVKRESRRLDKNRTEHSLIYGDVMTGLQLRCVGVEYADYPVVEWTLYFKNNGQAKTPIISDIQALDAVFASKGSKEVRLHHFTGDNCSKDSFEPHRTEIVPGTDLRFAPTGGRPSTGAWPYYHLEWNGGGVILAIGWPGQWACRFTRTQGVSIRAGQELTHFALYPGEEVRTPLIALMFHKRDWISGQNLWRRWMLVQNFPKDHGKSVSPKLAGFCGNYFLEYRTHQKAEVEFIDRYVEEGLSPDWWWIDAGWYPCGENWWRVGTWEVERERFPGGLRAVSDHARSKGMQFILWF